MARDLILMTMAGKYTCGQCCISMVTFVAMQDALNSLELKGGTNFKNMIDALNRLKVPCDQKPRLAGRPPIPVKRAIVRIKTKRISKVAYFVVWSSGAWYDPFAGFSEKQMHEKWPREFYPDSFIEIKN